MIAAVANQQPRSDPQLPPCLNVSPNDTSQFIGTDKHVAQRYLSRPRSNLLGT